jgi:hypothetical protein
MKTIALGLVALSALAAGCASTPLPADRMGNAQASIRGAEVAGARSEPTAALHLRLAQDNYAELALLLAKEHAERAEAQRLMEQAQGGGVGQPPATPAPATPAPQTPVP